MIWMTKKDYQALKDQADKAKRDAARATEEADEFARHLIDILGLAEDYPQYFPYGASRLSPHEVRDTGAQRFMRDVLDARSVLTRNRREKESITKAKATIKRIRKAATEIPNA